MRRREVLGLAAGGLAAPLALPLAAKAQGAWPNMPIRLVVPFAAGGPTDIPARLLADELSKALPQRVIVENRTGAGVVVGSDAVAKANKDGHTFLYTTIAHSVLRVVFAKLPFDPISDFEPVALTGVIPMVVIVNKELPVNSLKELIELFRKNPGKYDYGSTGAGAALHLATEQFLKQAGDLKVNHVPYRGESAAMPDLLSGTITMMISIANSALPFVKDGAVKALAITSSQRLPQLPDLPTVSEAGVPGYEAYTWQMVMAPAGTPEPIVAAMNAAINKVMAMDSVKQKLSDLTMQTRSDTTPATAGDFLKAEIAKWEPIVKAAGITAQ